MKKFNFKSEKFFRSIIVIFLLCTIIFSSLHFTNNISTKQNKIDITNLNLGLTTSNDLTNDQVLSALRTKADNRLTNSDFKFDIIHADYDKTGKYTITARKDSEFIRGSQEGTLNRLTENDISNFLENFNATNETTKQEILVALNKELNGSPVINDDDIDFKLDKSDFGKDGKITLSSLNPSKLLGEKELHIQALQKIDISNFDLELSLSNEINVDDILRVLKLKIDHRITSQDLQFNLIRKADYGQSGEANIVAARNSKYIKGQQKLKWDALPPKNLLNFLENFNATNETTKQEILVALNKELNGSPVINDDDIDFKLDKSDFGKDGKITLSSLNPSKLLGKKELYLNSNIDISKFDDLESELAKNSMLDNKNDVLNILKKRSGENRITEQDFTINGLKSENSGLYEGNVSRGYIIINGERNLTGYLRFDIYPVGDVLFKNIFNLDIKTPNKSTSVFYNKEQGGAIKQEMRRRVRETLNYDSDVFWNKINIVVDTSRKVIFVSNENSDGIKVDNPGGALWLYKGQFPYVYY